MRKILSTTVACGVLAMAGCGGGDDDEGSTDGGAGGSDGAVVVTMKGLNFEPKNVTVKVGETVRWVNEDSVNHDAVAKTGDKPKSELFGKGESYEATFDTAGRIDYVCTVHPGMEGTITVQ